MPTKLFCPSVGKSGGLPCGRAGVRPCAALCGGQAAHFPMAALQQLMWAGAGLQRFSVVTRLNTSTPISTIASSIFKGSFFPSFLQHFKHHRKSYSPPRTHRAVSPSSHCARSFLFLLFFISPKLLLPAAAGWWKSTMKEYLDSDRVNFLIWRFVLFFSRS